MGFFNKPASGPAGVLAPLSAERITGYLDANGMRYGVDDDGDIGGYWDGHLFFFFRLGEGEELLQIRGRWNRRVEVSELDAMLRLVNDWNADRLWPKLYVRVEEDVLGVYAEHTVDYRHGVTDEQIDLHVTATFSTALAFFERLDEAYPEQAAAAKAAFDQE
ncbi:YbjN domain-containing protein [Cellulomonas fimi]|uniref:Sensory transduction regulator n=1 Tax=Cellulomonas fimi (strain ATCC 484 / DSM 20113 / JCM 1341 / CCUG 24087 / LMG 16345 / NBRC 15513 / NCIMB 8980 / NCTC 7547 / NRS-133) TaxID=590998 RepID=F4H4Q6_CELFA|nr:YbjN domain-containing protein [Cellulomonas fimi]AEE44257.1 hypothetical protein Celf_0107 [Cellulomonas fimi ATCC 484]NNH05704.1 YbjN domain-containing protein [Cellulomonas fimi]VEH25984.1 Uncharacterised protein [Cellulomonas fimi]